MMSQEVNDQLKKWLAECDRVGQVKLCTHRNVGAVIIKCGEVVSTGRNTMPGHDACIFGSCPRGQKSYDEVKPDYSDCIGVHAEMNAIIHAGIMLCRGSLLVVNSQPCHLCMLLARGAQLNAVAYRHWSGEIRSVRL